METLFTYLPGLYVLIVFGIGATFMITKKLPALLTLPLMAFFAMMGMAIYGNMPYFFGEVESSIISWEVIWKDVFGEGVKMLAGAMIIAFLGGAISFMMQKSGVAEQMVKNGAELIGDNPLAVAIFCMSLVGLMFTTLGGLGAVIMVSIVLMPMMATVGIPPIVIGGIMVIGISLGGSMNAGNWVRFVDGMGIPYESVRDFAIVVFVHVYAAGICFITVEMWRSGALKSTTKMLSIVIGTIVVAMLIVLGIWQLSLGEGGPSDGGKPAWLIIFQGFVLILIVGLHLIILIDIYLRIPRWRHQIVKVKWFAYLIPIIPLVYIIVFGMDPYSAFMLGIFYAMLSTARPGSVSLVIQSLIQGAATVMPAVILFMGIGMLIMVFKGPGNWDVEALGVWPTIKALNPYFYWLKPTPIVFLIFFAIMAPGALYRGPLNTWGLGFGVAAILIDTVGFGAPVIMGMLLMVGQIQGVCDPTNTDNVWISNELRIDVQQLMLRTLPYLWVMAIAGLFVTVLFFRDDFTQEMFMQNKASTEQEEVMQQTEDKIDELESELQNVEEEIEAIDVLSVDTEPVEEVTE